VACGSLLILITPTAKNAGGDCGGPRQSPAPQPATVERHPWPSANKGENRASATRQGGWTIGKSLPVDGHRATRLNDDTATILG
jgi:hypothetical protein